MATTSSCKSPFHAKVPINTVDSPYRIDRTMPNIPATATWVVTEKEWMTFCYEINRQLDPMEETLALLKVVTVILVILYIVTTGGIVVRYAVVRDEQLGLVLSIVLFLIDLLLFSFHVYFLLFVVGNKLHRINRRIHELCTNMSRKDSASTVTFTYVHSGGCKVAWTDKIEASIEIAVDYEDRPKASDAV